MSGTLDAINKVATDDHLERHHDGHELILANGHQGLDVLQVQQPGEPRQEGPELCHQPQDCLVDQISTNNELDQLRAARILTNHSHDSIVNYDKKNEHSATSIKSLSSLKSSHADQISLDMAGMPTKHEYKMQLVLICIYI